MGVGVTTGGRPMCVGLKTVFCFDGILLFICGSYIAAAFGLSRHCSPLPTAFIVNVPAMVVVDFLIFAYLLHRPQS